MSGFLNYLREQILTERDVMDVVVKLLALADRPGSPHEGESALKQATELAKKHNIDLNKAREMMKNQTVRRSPSSSSPVHPADKLFADLTLILKHVPGMRSGDRMKSGTTYKYFGSDVVVWGLSHNGVVVMVVLPMNGERERPTHWYLVLGDVGKPGGYQEEDVLAKSTNPQDVLNAIRSVDWNGIKKKRDQDRIDSENAAYNNAQQLTHEAQQVVDIATKHGYVLKPASTGMTYREMVSEPYRLTIGPDGAWWHETRQGPVSTNKWKYDTKRFDQKNKGPVALDKWIKTKRKSGEANFSVHDEVNKVVKILTHFGFKPWEKQGNQHIWGNPVEQIRVTFGPNKMRGALAKDDEIWWMITAEYVRKDGPGGGMRPAHDIKGMLGDAAHGKDAQALERSLSKLMKAAEMGFDKVVAVLSKYDFKPDNHIVDRPDHTKEYFNSPGGKYFVMVDPKTGRWNVMKHWSIGSGPNKVWGVKDGHTADELDKVLSNIKGKLNDPKED